MKYALCIIALLIVPFVFSLNEPDIFLELKTDYVDKMGNYSPTTSSAPSCGGYCTFDGTNNYVDTGISLSSASEFAFGCWAENDDWSPSNLLDFVFAAEKTTTAGYNSFGYYYYSSDPDYVTGQARRSQDTTSYYSSKSRPGANVWKFYAMRKNSTQLCIFLDNDKSCVSMTDSITTKVLSIGDMSAYGYRWDGSITNCIGYFDAEKFSDENISQMVSQGYSASFSSLQSLWNASSGGNSSNQSGGNATGNRTIAFTIDAPYFYIIDLVEPVHYCKSGGTNCFIFSNMTQWAAGMNNTWDVAMIISQGDHTNAGLSSEWQGAQEAIWQLNGTHWNLTIGNHDYDQGNSVTDQRVAGNFTSRFGEPNKVTYFNASNRTWGVMQLELCPSNNTLDWAVSEVSTYPNTTFIISTHIYLNEYGVLASSADTYGCDYFTNMAQKNHPITLWERLVNPYNNTMMILSSHLIDKNASNHSRTTSQGREVMEIFAHYSWYTQPNDGNGYVRIYNISPSLNLVDVKTYSSYLNQFETTPENEFNFTVYFQDIAPGNQSGGNLSNSSGYPYTMNYTLPVIVQSEEQGYAWEGVFNATISLYNAIQTLVEVVI